MQGHLPHGGLAFAHAEKFKIAAQVENIELVLVLPIHQPQTQPGAPADHLPEFRLAHHFLEEHQIQHIRHVDAGVQHIHGDGDLRQLVRFRELVDSALGVGHVVVDDLGVTGQVGVLLPEYL